MELLRYLSLMGPMLVKFAKAGAFDPAVWTVEDKAAAARDFDQTLAAIAAHSDAYASLLGDMSDADFRSRDRDVRQQDDARGIHRQPGAVWMRGLSHAAVRVSEGVRARRVEHHEPVGRTVALRRCGRPWWRRSSSRAGRSVSPQVSADA